MYFSMICLAPHHLLTLSLPLKTDMMKQNEDPNDFRRLNIYTQEMDTVLRRYHGVISDIFHSYASRGKLPVDAGFMTFREVCLCISVCDAVAVVQ